MQQLSPLQVPYIPGAVGHQAVASILLIANTMNPVATRVVSGHTHQRRVRTRRNATMADADVSTTVAALHSQRIVLSYSSNQPEAAQQPGAVTSGANQASMKALKRISGNANPRVTSKTANRTARLLKSAALGAGSTAMDEASQA
jgi:hypothetical protein